jgi:hypothetical protein
MYRHLYRPILEPLEQRRAPASCQVTRLGDFGVGSSIGSFSRGDLRFCITTTNATPGPDVIEFRVTGTINLNSGLPDLEDDVQITGPGASLLTIDAQQRDRLFHVTAGADVEISGITLTNGYVADASGGGIHNEGTLTMAESVLSNSTAEQVLGGDFLFGGGIYNIGTLAISNATISFNTVKGDLVAGGGVYNQGELTVSGSTLSNNRAGSHVAAEAFGGGIYNVGQVSVTDSSITSSLVIGSVKGGGGGIHNESAGEVTVVSSLIAGNRVFGAEAFGGGILNRDGDVTIIGSTLSGNTARFGTFSHVESAGGGIAHVLGTLVVHHSTIAHNRTDDFGGGVRNLASFEMSNTIVANNIASAGRDLHGSLTSLGHNLVSNSSGGAGYAPSDILDVNPMLGPLDDNGGLTQTHALLAGSPAIDAGDPSPADPPMWDQRGPGFARVVNGRIDIGAYEVQAGTITETASSGLELFEELGRGLASAPAFGILAATQKDSPAARSQLHGGAAFRARFVYFDGRHFLLDRGRQDALELFF